MGSRSLALFVVLVVLGLVAFGALFIGREPDVAPPPAAPPSAASTSSSALELAEPPPAETSELAPQPADTGRSEVIPAEPSSVAPLEIATPEGEALLLEVIDSTNAPAAGVDVRYATTSRLREPECLERVMDSAASVRTDEKGLARLPVPRDKVVDAVARRDGFLGEATFGARTLGDTSERRERLVLVPDWDLVVEVVDDALKPATDVRLKLSTDTGAKGLNDMTNVGRDGRARFARVGHKCAPGRPLRVSAQLPYGGSVATLVEREPEGGEPVRLRLPPLGTVEVAVLAPDRSPADIGTEVSLRLTDPGAAERSAFAWEPPKTVSKRARMGRAVFEQVPLGRTLEIAAERELERARAVVAGPQLSGERVQATLVLGLAGTRLVFRAVDPAGLPISTGVSLNVLTGSEGAWAGQSSFSREARFEVELDNLGDADRRLLEVHSSARGLAARVDLGRSFSPGRHEMGDVVLAQAPLVAEGRVVDAGGSPVAGAEVTWGFASGRQGSTRFGALGIPQTVVTDAGGAFALRGLVSCERVQLSLSHAELRCEPIDVAVGASGLEIVLTATGGLAGRVLLDAGIPMTLQVRVLDDQTSADVAKGEMHLERGGGFECLSLPAGSYTLSVSTEGELLAEVRDVVIVAGEVTRDPRIQEIDLRGRLHVFRIRLVRPTRESFPPWELSWSQSGVGDPDRTRKRLSRAPDVALVTPLARIDATLRVEGYRVEHLVDLAPETEVHLRPGYPVRLVLPRGAKLPEPPLFLGIALGDLERHGEPRFFDAQGEALLHASEARGSSVVWVLERRLQGGGGQSVLADPSGSTVVVEDRIGEQRVALAITPDGLAALLEPR